MGKASRINKLTHRIEESVATGRFLAIATSEKTHFIKHVTQDNVSLLNGVLTDATSIKKCKHKTKERKFNSCFITDNPDADVDEIYDATLPLFDEVVLKKAHDIAEWSIDAEQHDKQGFRVVLPRKQYGIIGKGYVLDDATNTLHEYTTEEVMVVLRKDSSLELGFSLHTAYPYLESQTSRPTGKNLQDIVVKTQKYQNASPTGKAYILAQTNRANPYLTTFKAGMYGNNHDDVIAFQIPCNNERDYQDVVRIKENEMIIFRRHKEYDSYKNWSWRKDESVYWELDGKPKNLAANLLNPDVFSAFDNEYGSTISTIIMETFDRIQTEVAKTYSYNIHQSESLKENLLCAESIDKYASKSII